MFDKNMLFIMNNFKERPCWQTGKFSWSFERDYGLKKLTRVCRVAFKETDCFWSSRTSQIASPVIKPV